MKKRNMLLIVLLLFLVLGAGVYTYARYASTITGNQTLEAAAWVINVNEQDVTAGNATLNNHLTLALDASDHVVDNKIAPARGGSVDVIIDPAGTEVSLDYEVAIGEITNKPANVKVQYAVGGGEKQDVPATNKVTGEILLTDKTNGLATGDKVTVHLYFTWPDGDSANNVADTADQGKEITVPVTVNLKQHV